MRFKIAKALARFSAWLCGPGVPVVVGGLYAHAIKTQAEEGAAPPFDKAAYLHMLRHASEAGGA